MNGTEVFNAANYSNNISGSNITTGYDHYFEFFNFTVGNNTEYISTHSNNISNNYGGNRYNMSNFYYYDMNGLNMTNSFNVTNNPMNQTHQQYLNVSKSFNAINYTDIIVGLNTTSSEYNITMDRNTTFSPSIHTVNTTSDYQYNNMSIYYQQTNLTNSFNVTGKVEFRNNSHRYIYFRNVTLFYPELYNLSSVSNATLHFNMSNYYFNPFNFAINQSIPINGTEYSQSFNNSNEYFSLNSTLRSNFTDVLVSNHSKYVKELLYSNTSSLPLNITTGFTTNQTTYFPDLYYFNSTGAPNNSSSAYQRLNDTQNFHFHTFNYLNLTSAFYNASEGINSTSIFHNSAVKNLTYFISHNFTVFNSSVFYYQAPNYTDRSSFTPLLLPTKIPTVMPSAASRMLTTVKPSNIPIIMATSNQPSLYTSSEPTRVQSLNVTQSRYPTMFPSMRHEVLNHTYFIPLNYTYFNSSVYYYQAPNQTELSSFTPSSSPTKIPNIMPSTASSSPTTVNPSNTPTISFATIQPSPMPLYISNEPSGINATQLIYPTIQPTIDGSSLAPTSDAFANMSYGSFAPSSCIPSTSPSVSRSTLDSTISPNIAPAPTESPTIVPTRAATNSPLLVVMVSDSPSRSNDSSNSTTKSTSTPSTYSTFVPSPLPSLSPSAQPTKTPSTKSTLSPSTMKPSRKPTDSKSQNATFIPSGRPTQSPTGGPTNTQMKFENRVTVGGSKVPCILLSNSSKLAFSQATAKVLNVSALNVRFLGCETSSAVGNFRVAAKRQLASTYTLSMSSEVIIPLQYFYSILGAPTNDTADFARNAFKYSDQQLTNAVTSGLFSQSFQVLSKHLNATDTASVTVLGSSTANLQIIFPPTLQPTMRPTIKSHNVDELAPGYIAVIVIGGVFLVLTLCALLYFYWNEIDNLLRCRRSPLGSKARVYLDVESNENDDGGRVPTVKNVLKTKRDSAPKSVFMELSDVRSSVHHDNAEADLSGVILPLSVQQDVFPQGAAPPSTPSPAVELRKSIHNTQFKEVSNHSLIQSITAPPPKAIAETDQQVAPPPRVLSPLSPPPRLSDLLDEPTTTTPIASMNSLNHSRKIPSPRVRSKSAKSSSGRKVKKSSIIHSPDPG